MTQDIMRRILRDYFGYEVNFVMNITDVDDKVSRRHPAPPFALASSPRPPQIILRARHSHLLDLYLKSSAQRLSPALLTDLRAAWSAYVVKTLSPALPAFALSSPPSFENASELWKSVQAKEVADPAWAEEQKAREEKWGMYKTAVRAGLEAIDQAQGKEGGAEEAKELVAANREALGIWLDKKVRFGFVAEGGDTGS